MVVVQDFRVASPQRGRRRVRTHTRKYTVRTQAYRYIYNHYVTVREAKKKNRINFESSPTSTRAPRLPYSS